MRKSWDQYFLDVAEQIATRSTCNRLSVGCLIVKDRKVVSSGYNGSIHRHQHCHDVGCLLKDGRCVRTLHAEENAILHAERSALIGATAYVTHEPCEHCVKRLNQSGIVRVVFRKAYPNEYNQYFVDPMEWVHLAE